MENRMVRLSLNSSFGRAVVFRVVMVIAAGFMLVVTGCSTTQKRVSEAPGGLKEAYESQRSYVVSSSEDDGRPDWVHETSFEKDGKMCFSGGFLNGTDYAVTIRCANAEALKVAIQDISQYIRSEFTGYVQGSNTNGDPVERYVEDGLASFANNIHTQGIRQAEVYYEEVISSSVMRPTFNVFVRLEMSKADYLKAKADVLRQLRDRFDRNRQIAAKKKAEKLLDALKQDLREEALGFGIEQMAPMEGQQRGT